MAQTISEAMIEGTLGHELGNEPLEPSLPWHLDMLDSAPRVSALMGTKVYRGGGTILRGGSGVGQGANAALNWGGATKEGWKQANYANPRNWGRYGSQDYFHDTTRLTTPRTGGGKAEQRYSPYYMAAGANWVGRGMMGEGAGRAGGFLANTKMAENLQTRGLLAPGGEIVSRGFLARTTAASRVGMSSEAAMGRRAGTTAGFLQGAGYSADAAQGIAGNRLATQQALLTSGSGTITSRIGGFTAAAGRPMDNTVMRQLQTQARGAASPAQAAAQSAVQGARTATQWGAEMGLQQGVRHSSGQILSAGVKSGNLAKAAGMVGARAGMAASGVLMPAAVAWTAFDLARMGTKGVGHAASIGVDAYKSYRGDINKGILEGGFTDTEATMTSRARGVEAIQNSRLNARSILGNEAGSMAAHFG